MLGWRLDRRSDRARIAWPPAVTDGLGCGVSRAFPEGRSVPVRPNMRKWFELPPLLNTYERRLPLVLINGLAEQSESWFGNRVYLSRHFDVKVPELLVYDGDALHHWIDSGGEVTVDYLTKRLCALPRRVRSTAALSPRGIEPGQSNRTDLCDDVSREGLQAGVDLPIGFSRG